MKLITKIIFFGHILFCLSSCGNRFAVSEGIAGKLSSIDINVNGETIYGYEFINHLSNILNAKASSSKYRLDISLEKKNTSLVIRKDADAVRENIEIIINFKLYNKLNEQLLYSGKIRQISSYNTLFSPFSTNVELIQTDSDLGKSSAEELRRRLILFFKRTELSK